MQEEKKMTRNFKNKKAYLNWLGYGHATKVFEKTPGNQKVTIANFPYKVKHIRKKR